MKGLRPGVRGSFARLRPQRGGLAGAALFGLALVWRVVPAQTADAATNRFAPEYSEVRPGLDYAQLRIKELPWSIHVARLHRDQTNLTLHAELARGVVQGLETVSQLARRLRAAGRRPLAVINGDYFIQEQGPAQGDPGGLHVQRGELISTPANTSFWLDSNGVPRIEVIGSRAMATFPGSAKVAMGLNQAVPPRGCVLFTAAFGSLARITNGVGVILEPTDTNAWLPLRAQREYVARVRAVCPPGELPIQPDLPVLALGGQLTNALAVCRPGVEVRLATTLSRDLTGAPVALGGGPVLLTQGRANPTLARLGPGERALPRHPRSAIGFNDRFFFMVVVDGRRESISLGMTYPELAELMRQLGCVDAMNLDGGGSTTLWVNGKVRNSPSGYFERPVGNALVIQERAP